MAVVKIKPVKTRIALKSAVNYILNPAKTDGKMLASSFGCSYETAYEEFSITLSKAMEKGNNRAHHLIQAFEPGETTPEQAHEIGRRLADEATHGRHEYIITTHIDKGHIHNHILFCAASNVDYKKYVSNKKSLYGIRNFSDKLCMEYGLSVVQPGQKKAKSYGEYAADRDRGGSWKSKLKSAIDAIIPQSKDFEDFLKRMEASGHEIKRGKYISIRAPGQVRFTRTKTLGADYAEDAIKKRIAGDYMPAVEQGKKVAEFLFDEPEETGADIFAAASRDKPVYVRPAPAVNLIIDIENCVKAQQSAGFARWQKIQNLKEAAKTLNFLTENNLLQYADLENKAAAAAAAFEETADMLKAAEKRLADMAVLIKNIEKYQETKPVYDGLQTAKNQSAYRRGHESEIIIHEAAVRVLRKHAGDGGKLPNPAALKSEYERLAEKKSKLRADYNSLKRQAKEYGVVKLNVDSILEPGVQRTRSKDRSAEL